MSFLKDTVDSYWKAETERRQREYEEYCQEVDKRRSKLGLHDIKKADELKKRIAEAADIASGDGVPLETIVKHFEEYSVFLREVYEYAKASEYAEAV
jgi:hypothetical protein